MRDNRSDQTRYKLAVWVISLAATGIGFSSPAGADAVIETSQFSLTMQQDNAFLPSSIRWKSKNHELLDPKSAAGHEFISFENRSKIYHFEHKQSYPGQTDPRFANDAKVLGVVEAVARPGYKGAAVALATSYAAVQRTIWLGEDTPRISIEYAFDFTRDVVLHEAQNFTVGLRFNEGFDTQIVADARQQQPELLRASGLKSAGYSASVLNAGPKLFIDTKNDAAILVSTSIEGVPPQPLVKLLTFSKGQHLVIRLNLEIDKASSTALQKSLLEQQKALPEYFHPFALLETARLLEAQQKLKEAEAALLRAANQNKDYAAPFAALAGLRRDHKQPGLALAWAQAAYRNPYNYGYMLSAIELHHDEKLTEEQKRQHIFNILIVVENAPFYPDYYSWAARGFEEMGMYAQASAIHRQALWALSQAPYSPEKKAKEAKLFETKLAELEGKMVGQTVTKLPDLTPVHPPVVGK